MKSIILNDIHFGKSRNSKSHLESLKNIFYNEIIPLSKSKDINSLFILGDLLDSEYSIAHFISIEIDKIFNILKENLKIYILIGNHDLLYKNDYETHSLERFNNMDNIELLVGSGYLNINNKSIYYNSFNRTETIYENMKNNNIKGDVFLGHLDNTHRNFLECVKYINDNFNHGLSGHIHIYERRANFHYLPSLQEHQRNDKNTFKGYIIYDWLSNDFEFIKNDRSSKFKEIVYPELNEIDIKNNYIDIYIDISKIDKKSDSVKQKMINDYINDILKYNPADILSKSIFQTVDNNDDDENDNESLEDIEDFNFKHHIVNSINDMDDVTFKEETINKIKNYIDN